MKTRGRRPLPLSSSAVFTVLRSQRRARFALALLAAILATATPAAAQSANDRDQSGGLSNPMEALRSRLSTSGGATTPLEGPVDPAVYRVGPGDVFAISIATGEGTAASVPVSADGLLMLPESGSVRVAGLTLAAARDSALVALRRSFGRLRIDVALAQPRSFWVHVSGAVPVPGRFLAAPVARVSSVLEVAFADTSRAAVANPAFRPALRNVTLIRRDGGQVLLDMARYFATGAVDENPYLSDGDVIVVPGYDPAYASVRVDGAVPFPGAYDVREGDTVRRVLEAAGLAASPEHATAVRLTRFEEDGLHTIELLASAVFENETGETTVRARDHVSVVADRPAQGSASVEGWVRSPGTFSIESGVTTVRDLLEQAGGMRDGALLDAAHVVRGASGRPEQTGLRGRPSLTGFVRPDTLEALRSLRLTELELASRMYFAQEFEATRRIPIDPDGEPVVLQDGDRLVIPRDERTVHVFGQVVRPGYLAYEPGRAADWFVEAAGGRGANAGRVLHLRAATGAVVTEANAEVRSGDVIFVDRATAVTESFAQRTADLQQGQLDLSQRQVDLAHRQLELSQRQLESQERNQKREQRYRIFQSLLGTVSTVATIIVLFRSLENQQ